MEKLQMVRKRKPGTENPRMDPLMRALKALHSAGSPENMTPEELEHQRRNQELLGRLTAPMAGMDYEAFSIGGMPAAWTRLKTPHGDRRVILYCHGGGYTSGNLGYSRVLSSKLAHATGYDVLSFEYRLAPEHPYPAAVEDAVRAWDYLMYQGYGAGKRDGGRRFRRRQSGAGAVPEAQGGRPPDAQSLAADVPVDGYDHVRPVLSGAGGE